MKIKKSIATILLVLVPLLVTSCGGTTSTNATNETNETNTSDVEVVSDNSDMSNDSSLAKPGTVKSVMNADQTGFDVDKGQQQQIDLSNPVELNVLRAWNGSGDSAPKPDQDVVGKAIQEKFGVKINWEFCTGSEVEKLNLIFASGDMPDVIDFPFWGGTTGETAVLKRAQKDGLLRSIDGYIETYAPDVAKNVYKDTTQLYRDNELNNPDFDGLHYFIPRETNYDPSTQTTNWLYGVYIRKDIAEAVGFDNLEGFKTPDDVYALMSKIVDGNFKDTNGNSVMPLTTLERGRCFNYLTKFWDTGNVTSFWYDDSTKTYRDSIENKDVQYEKIDFARKLISDGYLNPESFTQETVAVQAQLANGSVAVVCSQNFGLTDTLFNEHPEMEYVPIKIPDSNGDVYSELHDMGRMSTPALAITTNASDEQTAKFFQVLNYLNTEEGQILLRYGIEGEHYKMVDGAPQLNDDLLQASVADPHAKFDLGIDASYTPVFTIADRHFLPEIETPHKTREDAYKQIIPIKFKPDGPNLNMFNIDYPQDKMEAVNTAKADYDKLITSAYFAKSDEEARSIMEAWYSKTKPMLDDYNKFITDAAAKYEADNNVKVLH